MKTKMCEINDSWVWLITAEEKINKLEDKQQKLSKLNTERKKLWLQNWWPWYIPNSRVLSLKNIFRRMTLVVPFFMPLSDVMSLQAQNRTAQP